MSRRPASYTPARRKALKAEACLSFSQFNYSTRTALASSSVVCTDLGDLSWRYEGTHTCKPVRPADTLLLAE